MVCKADTLGDARDGSLTGPKKIAMKLHANWGHAPAQQLKRALVDSEGNNMHLLTCVDEELARCEVCQAFEKAPHAPAAGASTVAVSKGKLQVDCLLSDGIIALRVVGFPSIHSLPILPAQRIPGRFGMPFAALGSEFPPLRLVSRWMRVRNGRMGYGRNSVPNDEPNCFFEGLVRTHGFLNVAMVSHVGFIID